MEKYRIKHAALTDIGLKRSLNEDAIGFIEINDGYIFVVCDGMGGHEGGEIASKAAVRATIEYLNSNIIENASVALHQAILYANQQVFEIAQNKPELRGMGTTAVVLLIYKDEIHTAHIGDSRIYVCSDKNLIQITKDHSVVQEMVDNGILQQEEAESHPRKNEITKALGIKMNIVPSISSKPLRAKSGDRFLICSDGLSGMISKIQLTATLLEFSNADECAIHLIKLAKEGGGDDNISVQVIDIIESPYDDTYYPTVTKINQTNKIQQTIPKKNNSIKLIASIIGVVLTIILIAGVKKLINLNKFEKNTKKVNDTLVITNNLFPSTDTTKFDSINNQGKVIKETKTAEIKKLTNTDSLKLKIKNSTNPNKIIKKPNDTTIRYGSNIPTIINNDSLKKTKE